MTNKSDLIKQLKKSFPNFLIRDLEKMVFLVLSEIKLALKRAEDADLRIVVIEPKSGHFTGFLKELISEKSIIVVNKSDLFKEKLDPEISKLNHVLVSLKDITSGEELTANYNLYTYPKTGIGLQTF